MNQMIKRLILICLLINIINCKEEIQSNNEIKKGDHSETKVNSIIVNDPILTQEKLMNSKWFQDQFGILGYSISFEKESKYHIEFFGEGCGQHWIGDYSLKSLTQVLLKRGIQQQTNNCQPDKLEKTCNYRKVFNPVSALYLLDCGEDEKYFNVSELLPSNTKMQFKDVSVITLGNKQGVTTDDAKLREKPDINSKFFSCLPETPIELKPFVTKNTKLILLFKTLEKQKVKKWENHWYYVYVDSGWYGRCDSQNNLGWIFGEFVKEDN